MIDVKFEEEEEFFNHDKAEEEVEERRVCGEPEGGGESS